MAEDTIDLSPSTELLRAMLEREGFGWEAALSELIDNSFDAGATRVSIHVDRAKKTIAITDNGAGCRSPERMLVPGDSMRRGRGGALGRYGIGLKDASMMIARDTGRTTIVTSDGERHWRLWVQWGDIIRSGRWRIAAPEALSERDLRRELSEGHGTKIVMQVGRGRAIMNRVNTEKALRNLGFRFSPGIKGGRQVEVRDAALGRRPVLLSAPPEPKWAEAITPCEIRIGDKVAHVRSAGILAADDKSGRRGISYAYGHRVLIQDSHHGTGSYGTQGFAAFVDLTDGWTLSQNKQEITDPDWDELTHRVYEIVVPLLEKLKRQARELLSELVREQVTRMLNAAVTDEGGEGGESRNRGEGASRKRKSSVDGKHRSPAPRKIGRLVIDFDDTRTDAEEAGWVEGHCITINTALAAMRESVDSGNYQSVAYVALGLFAAARRQQGLFADDDARSFANRWGKMLARPLPQLRAVEKDEAV